VAFFQFQDRLYLRGQGNLLVNGYIMISLDMAKKFRYKENQDRIKNNSNLCFKFYL
jgi:hypothetical protein